MANGAAVSVRDVDRAKTDTWNPGPIRHPPDRQAPEFAQDVNPKTHANSSAGVATQVNQ